MSRRKPSSDFQRAMDGVKPLADRDKLRAPPDPKPQSVAAADPTPQRFAVEHFGEGFEGLAAGVDRAQLLRLRQGGFEIEASIDLHGMRSEAARVALRRRIETARSVGARCVLVIHGRGLHSDGDSVLKQALPEWLAEPPLGRCVMAFASARARDGGAGATYVLLRRSR